MTNSDPKLIALSQLREALSCALKEATESARWFALSMSVPAGGAGALLDLEETHEAVYFSGGTGSEDAPCINDTYVGLGAAETGHFSGPIRFQDAVAFVQRTFELTHIPQELVPHVRFFGGASFSPGRDGTSEAWHAFGEARFTLPRCIYVHTNHSHLEHSVRDVSESSSRASSAHAAKSAQLICIAERSDCEPTLELAGLVLDALFQPQSAELKHLASRPVSRFAGEDRAGFHERVEAIKRAISSGAVQKVVAARRVTLALSDAPKPSVLMARLAAQAPLCARFALRLGDSTFVGATPERLIERRGRHIATEALAGSVSSQEVDAERLLLDSQKDLEEHALVVQALEEALSPVCSKLTIPKKPTVRRLRTILHLRTPISGELTAPTHVLSLVDRIHPTPAVGGLPKDRAVEFISRDEPVERGWYAAPVGWIDSRGDGEFVVALRSGLFTDGQVHLYSGAGIVKDSNAAQEFEETELKLRSMLEALGVPSEKVERVGVGGAPGGGAATGEIESDGQENRSAQSDNSQSSVKGPGRREPGGLGAHEKSPERPREFPSA